MGSDEEEGGNEGDEEEGSDESDEEKGCREGCHEGNEGDEGQEEAERLHGILRQAPCSRDSRGQREGERPQEGIQGGRQEAGRTVPCAKEVSGALKDFMGVSAERQNCVILLCCREVPALVVGMSAAVEHWSPEPLAQVAEQLG